MNQRPQDNQEISDKVIIDDKDKNMINTQQETYYNTVNPIIIENNSRTRTIVENYPSESESDDTIEYYRVNIQQRTNTSSFRRLQFLSIKMRKLEKKLNKLKEKLKNATNN